MTGIDRVFYNCKLQYTTEFIHTCLRVESVQSTPTESSLNANNLMTEARNSLNQYRFEKH